MITVKFLDNCKDGILYDGSVYRFQVSRVQASRTVVVRISGQAQLGPAQLGKSLSSDQLREVASAWLRSRLKRGDCDPFSRPGTDNMVEDLPSAILDYWVENQSIPPHLV
jgi:hypothetical protein